MIFLADDFSFVLVSNFMVILAKVNFLLQKSNTYFLFLRKNEKKGTYFKLLGRIPFWDLLKINLDVG